MNQNSEVHIWCAFLYFFHTLHHFIQIWVKNLTFSWKIKLNVISIVIVPFKKKNLCNNRRMSKIILLSDLFDYYVIYGGSLIFMCGVFIDFLVNFHFIPLFFAMISFKRQFLAIKKKRKKQQWKTGSFCIFNYGTFSNYF